MNYSSTTLYFKGLLQHYSVLQRITMYYKVLFHYYSVPQSTTPYYKVLLCTTKNYSVLQSTTPVFRTTKYYSSTTPYYTVPLQYYSFTRRGATEVTLQRHQIMRLPRKPTRMLDPRHTWNVIYNVQSLNFTSAPAALARLLFEHQQPRTIEKTRRPATFLTFGTRWSSF